MVHFDRDLLGIVQNVKFRSVHNPFQSTLKYQYIYISTDQLLVHAHKTRNLYKMNIAKYNKLLTENITHKYKTADDTTARNIETEFYDIANELDIGDRIDGTTQEPAFITLKNHKENFENNQNNEMQTHQPNEKWNRKS